MNVIAWCSHNLVIVKYFVWLFLSLLGPDLRPVPLVGRAPEARVGVREGREARCLRPQTSAGRKFRPQSCSTRRTSLRSTFSFHWLVFFHVSKLSFKIVIAAHCNHSYCYQLLIVCDHISLVSFITDFVIIIIRLMLLL